MRAVIDSSITLAWLFADKRTPAADAVLEQVSESGATVPSLWRLEVANALQMAVRKKRIDTSFRDASLADLRALDVEIDGDTDQHAWRGTLALADQHRLTLYDAAYLELAHRLRLPLVTLDRELRNAASAQGVALLGMAVP